MEAAERVLIVGAGLMGRGIAQACAVAGVEVFLSDIVEGCLQSAEEEIARGVQFLAESGWVPAGGKAGPVSYHLGLDGLPGSWSLIIEAITEDLEAKKNLFAELENRFPPETILASNTSSFPVCQMAGHLKYKGRVIGIHFIMPAQIVPIVEIIKGADTSEGTLAQAKAFCEKINKKPIIVTKEITGFVLNRLQHALHREAYYLINLGITTAEEIDLGIKGALAPRFLSTGLLEQKDISGIAVHFAVAQQIYPDLCNDSTPRGILPELMEKGYLGIKTGRGFYDWKGIDIKKHIQDKLQIQMDALKLFRS